MRLKQISTRGHDDTEYQYHYASSYFVYFLELTGMAEYRCYVLIVH
jgi:hypothetical protein